MSNFLSYSQDGALVGGFGPDEYVDHAGLFKRRRGGPWIRFANRDSNNPAHVSNEIVAWQQGAYLAPASAARVKLSDGQTFDYGATTIRGGGGRCVTSLAGSPPVLYDSAVVVNGKHREIRGDVRATDALGRPTAWWGAGKHDVGFDGTLVYSPRYHTDRAVVIEDAAGHLIQRFDSIPISAAACIDRHAIVIYSSVRPSHVWFWDGAACTEHALAFPSFEGHAFRGPEGKIYLVYISGALEQLVLHTLDDPARGWVFGDFQHAYNGVGWSDGFRSFVSWSANAGATLASITEQQVIGDPKPWPPTPVRVPTFKKTSKRIGIGMFDDLVGPRIIDTTETPSANTKALLHDERKDVPTIAQSRAVAKAAGLPCLRYSDRHGAVTDLKTGDRSLVYCYPKKGRSAAQTAALVRADLEQLVGKPFDCAVALYCQWNGIEYVLDEQLVLDTVDLLWDLFLEPGMTPGALWIMSKSRGGGKDGVAAFPPFQLTLNRLKAASGDWTHFPPRPADPAPPSGFFPPLQELI